MNRSRFLLFILCAATLLVSGCSTSYHKNKADKEVYAILQQAEEHVFQRKTRFSIDTATSRLPLKEITNSKILKKTNKKGSVKLNLTDCIEYATANSRAYQNQKEALYLVALNMSDAKIPFRLNPSSTADASFQRAADGTRLFEADSNNTLSTILRSGGSLSLSLANDLITHFIGGSNEPVSSFLTLNLAQPLLRGRGSEIAAENLTQSYRNVIYQLRTYASFQRNFSREIVIDYLRILQLEEQVQNELTNLKSRQENFEYLQARSIDRASPEEVADAQQEVLEAEVRYVNAQSDLSTSLDVFKVSIGMPAGITLELDSRELDRLVKAGLVPLKFTEKVAYQTALKHRSELLNDVDEFEDVRRQVIIAADELKTQLDFVSSTSIQSSGERWERLNFNDISTNIGLELDLPVNRRRERNDYRRTLILFDSEARALSQTHDQLRNLIKLRYREIEQFRRNYEIQIGAVKLAQRRVEGNQLRLKAGTLIFRRLSESQDALINAQNAVTSALVNYQESRLTLYEELGILDFKQADFWLKQ